QRQTIRSSNPTFAIGNWAPDLRHGLPTAERFSATGVTEYRPLQFHCGLMPANLITLPHFSVSSTISLPNWAGDPGSGVPPRSARRALILGSASATLISLFSFSTMCSGVFLGAPTPVQKLDS